jgi:hypothetical protein
VIYHFADSGVAQLETSDSSPPPIINAAVSGAITQPGTPHTAFLIVGLVLLVAINILFIIDIELTLRRNKGDQNGNEATWGFGRVLALLLLILLFRDALGHVTRYLGKAGRCSGAIQQDTLM